MGRGGRNASSNLVRNSCVVGSGDVVFVEEFDGMADADLDALLCGSLLDSVEAALGCCTQMV
jgi:hypothetical protein